jgi:hypothetical protein
VMDRRYHSFGNYLKKLVGGIGFEPTTPTV